MVKTRDITVRVTINEHERIKNLVSAKGYPTISAFVRDVTLRNPLTIEEKIVEMHQAIVGSKNEINRAIKGLKDNAKGKYLAYAPQNQYSSPLPKDYTPQPKQNPIYKADPLNEPEPQDMYDFQDPDC